MPGEARVFAVPLQNRAVHDADGVWVSFGVDGTGVPRVTGG